MRQTYSVYFEKTFLVKKCSSCVIISLVRTMTSVLVHSDLTDQAVDYKTVLIYLLKIAKVIDSISIFFSFIFPSLCLSASVVKE